MMNKINKIALFSALSGLLMLNTVGIVYAVGDLTPDAVITGGSLGITELSIENFSAVTLDGTTQTTVAIGADTTLTDSTGSGDGWQVSLKATPFALDAAGVSAAPIGAVVILPEDSLVIGTVTIEEVADTGSTPITVNTIISGGAIDNAAGVNILSTPINEGMGTYTVSMLPMTLTLFPQTTYAGTYTSTVTQTLTSGPVN